MRWHDKQGLVKKTNVRPCRAAPAPAPTAGNQQEERFVACQADGYPKVVMKAPGGGQVVAQIPNQEVLVKIGDAGADYLVRWHAKQGLVKKTNVRPCQAAS